jgi:putative ABC transport system permease protein
MRPLSILSRWLLWGEWRTHPVRALLAILAIAVGVAMGFAIHLINAAAFNEFSAAVKSIAGQADIQVSGREPTFDEAVFPELARRAGVQVASPVLEVDAGVPAKAGQGLSGGTTLKIIGIDPFRAGAVSPDLLGVADSPLALLSDDAIFLSPAAMNWLHTNQGAALTVRAGSRDIPLTVGGGLFNARAGQRLGVMDIGAAQWRFSRLGQLSRIDLKLAEGVDRGRFEQTLKADLERRYPGRFQVAQPNDPDQDSRTNTLSRAYRVNLTVLALVALFTGAFLVFSTQALSVIRRRSQFALLRVLGVERRELLRQVLLEGISLGVLGAAAGIAGGYLMAALALRFFGADLGAGYFTGVQPTVQFTPVAAAVFFSLGLGVALLGCLAPALEAARAAPAVALKSGSDETALAGLARIWPSAVCLLLAALFSRLPPIFALPIFGYLAIALLLVGGIGLMPRLAASVFGAVNRRATLLHAVPALTMARLANASGQAAIALGGVLASFSLMVAMAIMVSSFRVSVDDWLVRILPADLYVRVAAAGATAGLGPNEQAAIAASAGVARSEFLRTRPLSLDPARPPITLIARQIDAANPGERLVLVGRQLDASRLPPGSKPAWVSEAMLDLYQVQPGQHLQLPLAGKLQDFIVAGAWRDYASQNGSVQVRLADYRAITGDDQVSDAALWFQPGVTADAVEARLRRLPFGAALQLARPGQIRAVSLQIFDRSFAVTYLLEAIAIAIGLSGVAATFSAQTLARSREFGMLRHVGVTRGQILRILALEGGALTALGVLCGFALGVTISLILVFVVNPQSFHWTMQLHLPWGLLAAVASLLLGASVLTALVSGRYALSGGPIRAVREDW